MKHLLILSIICIAAFAAYADDKPAATPATENKDEAPKPAEEKKEEEKPSPPPSGPQSDGRFRKVVLDVDQKVGDKYEDTLSDPMELTVAPDGRVFFVERAGKVKMWRPDTETSVEIGKIEVFTGLEDGLIGITLDPKFSVNSWIYLMYSLPETGTNAAGKKVGINRVSRFTFTAEKLDIQSEKSLIEIPTQREQCCHAGGSLAFDRHGNLYISTGDNTNPFDSDGFSPVDQRPDRSPWDAQKSSANANDLRGKVLRIRPQADGSYTIPDGNLFAAGKSKTAPAAKGAELLRRISSATASASGASRPEIYVMGCRNPFRISIDPKSDFLYFGDVGPDAAEFKEQRGPAGFDEINQVRAAGNFGWPHFIAENKPYWKRNFAAPTNAVVKTRFDPLKPLNRSPNNTGLKNLPPAQPAFIWYPHSASARFPVLNGEGGRTAMAGPVYYYDESLKSDRKLPKEFDSTLFIYEWSRSWIIAVKLDQDGKIEKMERFCPNMTFKRPMDMELGPDGCLYLIEWGTAWGKNKDTQIVRVEYAPELARATSP
ncbi:MAG: PQQ-dependent sugar dehydrogenase [Verrucomicrobia bacterium]|nr:PQQ-dependent sugar dehydrogenase [Verrucomicrobiota bacterium]